MQQQMLSSDWSSLQFGWSVETVEGIMQEQTLLLILWKQLVQCI